MSLIAKTTQGRSSSNSLLGRNLRPMMVTGLVTLLAAFLLYAYLYPMTTFFYSSLRDGSKEQGSPRLPSSPRTFEYNGEKFEVFLVPIDGTVHQLALVKRSRSKSTFIDPANPSVTIEWEGRWRGLQRAWVTDPQWKNYPAAWKQIDYPKLLRNTFIIAFLATVGAVLSAIVVAYGFSRFSVPGKAFWMAILMATIILPPQVTIVPTYILFYKIGWVGTFLPLIVPHFFANAWNVFLLRQFFLNIPKELDEAAMIDGATPLYILRNIIVPLSWPAIIAVTVNHFLFSWNDFFSQILYLAGKDELKTITPGIQSFNSLFGGDKPHLIAAAAIIASILPIVLFFAAQRPFMRSIMTQGVDK